MGDITWGSRKRRERARYISCHSSYQKCRNKIFLSVFTEVCHCLSENEDLTLIF